MIQLSQADTALLASGGALTIQGYQAPVVVVPPPPPPPPPVTSAPLLRVVISQNGASPWPQDYSYSCTDAATVGGDGNPACRVVTGTGPWSGYQPSNGNGGVTDFSGCSNLVVSVKGPKGTPFTMQFLRGGDVAIGVSHAFTLATDYTWERFSVPRSAVMTDAHGVDWSASIYKGAIQSHSGKADVFYVDNWGGI